MLLIYLSVYVYNDLCVPLVGVGLEGKRICSMIREKRRSRATSGQDIFLRAVEFTMMKAVYAIVVLGVNYFAVVLIDQGRYWEV